MLLPFRVLLWKLNAHIVMHTIASQPCKACSKLALILAVMILLRIKGKTFLTMKRKIQHTLLLIDNKVSSSCTQHYTT